MVLSTKAIIAACADKFGVDLTAKRVFLKEVIGKALLKEMGQCFTDDVESSKDGCVVKPDCTTSASPTK
jgi:hypothetical protein